jgi:Photosynthetic reaction centre cytochrome C subunit
VTRRLFATVACTLAPLALAAQAPHKFPPDSLINTKVFAHDTPVPQVLAAMRAFSGDLGVRCTFCHVGEEGKPLDAFDFASDNKRTKLVARQMMLMVAEVNRRLDTIPRTGTPAAGPGLQASCATCHRGVSRPAPLSTVVAEAASAGGADSALHTYRALHDRYRDRGSYDFGEGSLNAAAARLAQAGKYDDALALLKENEVVYPTASSTAVARGNVTLMRGDTSGAAASFREAIRRDSTNREARGRLRDIGRQP